MHSAAEAAAPSEHAAQPGSSTSALDKIHVFCLNNMSAGPSTLPVWQPCQWVCGITPSHAAHNTIDSAVMSDVMACYNAV